MQYLGYDYGSEHMRFGALACIQSDGQTKGDCYILNMRDPNISYYTGSLCCKLNVLSHIQLHTCT